MTSIYCHIMVSFKECGYNKPIELYRKRIVMAVFDNKLTIRIKLNEYDKPSILNFGYNLGLKGISRLKKADLIDRVAEELLKPDTLFYRIGILTDQEMELYKESMEGIRKIQYSEVNAARELNQLDLVSATTDEITALCDLATVYQQLDQEKLENYRKRASWVRKCIYWAEEIYVYAPIDVLLKLINVKKGFRMKEEELQEILDHYPKDECGFVRESNFIANVNYADYPDKLVELLRVQKEKDFYYPSADEIEELFESKALISGKPYQELLKFITEEIGTPQRKAENLLCEMWKKQNHGENYHSAMQWFWDQLILDNEVQANKLVGLYMKAVNGSRIQVNRGFTPDELRSMKKEKTVLPVNNARRVEKRIYPNDPCPCGSGKKYKKCCGRNK